MTVYVDAVIHPWPHYDTIASRRLKAIAIGAVEAGRWKTILVSNDATIAWCRVHAPDAVPQLEIKRSRWLARYEAMQMKEIAA
jgi:hypothetical protein